MKTMSYYTGYSNHCTPTAATNSVMYWKYGRGYFANNSSNQMTVFKWFHDRMNTTAANGTQWTYIWGAYVDYFTYYSGMVTGTSDQVSLVTFNKIKEKLSSDIPVHLEILSYGGGNHSVNVWGYSVSDSTNYLRITDNWGTSISNLLINFGAYSYGQFVWYQIIN